MKKFLISAALVASSAMVSAHTVDGIVKDNRTGYETGNINAVMDGALDGFMNAYLKYISKQESEN